MIKGDLHIHTSFSSDGELSVAEIVEKILLTDINLFSITDHNSVLGNEEAFFLAVQNHLDYIPGIEIDCNFSGTDLHLLGYHINYYSTDFKDLEEEIYGKVMASFSEMIHNINTLGFDVEENEVLTAAGNSLPTGELIAEVLLAKYEYDNPALLPYRKGGQRSDNPYLNFYHDYFAQGKPAYVYIEYMSYANAVELVMDNGGIPIVAHPGLNFKGREEVVEKLLDKGARGLEAFNNYHDAEQTAYFADLAEKKRKLITAGSDFHGKNKPSISLGNYRTDSKYNKYLSESLEWLKHCKILS